MERVTPPTVTWSPNWTLHGLWWRHGAPQIESSQRLRNTPSTTTPLPLKSGANEILAGNVHALASNMQLPVKCIDFRDYLRGNFNDFNIFSFVGTGVCKKMEYVNIRGHVGTDVTARFSQELSEYTLHIDTPSGSNNCQFNPKAGAVSSEDNFGWYGNSASALNSEARQQTNPPPSIGLVLSANLLPDKTALQWVTKLHHGPSHLIFKKHWFIDSASEVFHR